MNRPAVLIMTLIAFGPAACDGGDRTPGERTNQPSALVSLQPVLPGQTGRSLPWSPVGTRLEWSERAPEDFPESIRRYARELIDPVFGQLVIGPEDSSPRAFLLARTDYDRPYRERLLIDTAGDGRIDPDRDEFDAQARESRNRMWVTHAGIELDIPYGPDPNLADRTGSRDRVVRHEFDFWHVYPREDEPGEFNILRYSRRSWMEAEVRLHGEAFTLRLMPAGNTGLFTPNDRWSLERIARDDRALTESSGAPGVPEVFSSPTGNGIALEEPFFIEGQAYRLSDVTPCGTRATVRATADIPEIPVEEDAGPPRPQSEHTLAWHVDLDAARRDAAEEGRPLFLKWTATWCGPCLQMEREAFRDKGVVDLLREHFIIAKLDRDEQYRIADRMEIQALPTIQIFSAGGDEIERRVGLQSPERLEAWLLALISDP